MNKVETFRKIVNDMADLYEKKNENYGDSFGKLYQDLGPIAGLVPLHNKLDRLTNLIRSGESGDFESIEDSFKDLACYAVMNLIEMAAQKDSKIQEVDKSKSTMKVYGTIQYPDGHTEPINKIDLFPHSTSSNQIDGIVPLVSTKEAK